MATAALRRLAAASERRAARAAAGAQSLIDTLARAAFAQLWDALTKNPGADVRSLVQRVQVEFAGEFADALAEAFGTLMQRAVGVAEVRAMPVSGLSLSRRLYTHNLRTAGEVVAVIRQHAAGVHDARKLALELYDGYDPAEGIKRPLEGRARATLPRALRELTEDRPARQELTALMVRGQQQAARVKSKALRAAYTEAFEAWEQGAGREVLRGKLDNAMREKNRFFANRIAQTELHRAHQAAVAQELMADEEVTVVQVKINPLHPKTDICDLHAHADLWGLGPGLYPKEEAPRPPFHPFCRCVLRSKPSMFGALAVRRPGAEAAYLAGLGEGQAGAVMGSAARAQRVMRGTATETVINSGKAAEYRLVRVGQAKAQRHALLEES